MKSGSTTYERVKNTMYLAKEDFSKKKGENKEKWAAWETSKSRFFQIADFYNFE